MTDFITHSMGTGMLSPCGLEPASVYFGHRAGFTTDWFHVDCPDCLAKAPEGVGTPTLSAFYVTFGQMYRHEEHPHWPGADPDGWLRVLAPDEEAARLLVRSFIGLKWGMMYDSAHFDVSDARKYYPKGELAWVATDGGIGAAAGVGAPTPRLGASHPEYYGRDGDEIVAVRIEGTLKHGSDKDAIEKLGYEVEYYHPGCWLEGVQSWSNVTELDREVRAFELNWAEPVECPVCEVSIT